MGSKPSLPDQAQRPGWAEDEACPRVDRYCLGPEIGRGGMGRVHFGWDPMLRRLVAIKLLHGDDPEHHLRLLREARNQAKLDHPNVCRIHDLGIDGSRPYIAMQLILGCSLSELRPELDHRQMAALLADVAGAVHAAHKAGLIHRDLKPANVLVTGRGTGQLRPFVVDFGLARDLHGQDQTLSWAVQGTPAFMSPEQARGEAVGPATDIYSLGATLYAMLSGQPPYEGSTLAGLLAQQADRGVHPIRNPDRPVPKDLETIALKCLEGEASRRYGSAGELEDELRRFLAGEPIQARPVGPAGRLWRWARRKPALAGTAAAGILAVAMLASWNVHTVREGRLREAAAQRFGLEIRDAEHLLRIERMMPVHDIRPAEARLRHRIDEIQREMARLGGLARGPGLYALGRGHLALRERERAMTELEGAWKAGYRAPEVAYALAMALLEQHEQESYRELWLSRSPAKAAAKGAPLLDQARTWLKAAQGARVDHPDFGEGMVASAEGRYADAERSFAKSLEASPWLYEAWTARASNCRTTLLPKAWEDPQVRMILYRQASEYVAKSEELAPSDEACLLQHVDFLIGMFITASASEDRSEAPLLLAQEKLQRARTIRPDAEALVVREADTALQRAFFQLSTGGDPGPLMRASIDQLVARPLPREDPLPPAWLQILGHQHHAWWVVAEADWRFGRDPRPAIAQARSAAQRYPNLDLHHLFPLLVEGRYLQAHGGDPGPVYRKADDYIQKLWALTGGAHLDSPFVKSILGELALDRARWERERGGPSDRTAREGIVHLEAGIRKEPNFAYTYYFLPQLQALRARLALDRGANPEVHVRAALESAGKGVAINPRNAQLRLAAGEAHLADALARSAAGQDPRPALRRALAHLKAGLQVNTRDFRLWSTQAECDLLEARYLLEAGLDPAPALESGQRSCHAALGIKADQPGVHLFLAQASALRAQWMKTHGLAPGPAILAGILEARRALHLCPTSKEARDLLGTLEQGKS